MRMGRPRCETSFQRPCDRTRTTAGQTARNDRSGNSARRHHLRRQRRTHDASRVRRHHRRYDRRARRTLPESQNIGAQQRYDDRAGRGARSPAEGGQQHPETRFGIRRHGAADRSSARGLFGSPHGREHETLRRTADYPDDVPARRVRRTTPQRKKYRPGWHESPKSLRVR